MGEGDGDIGKLNLSSPDDIVSHALLTGSILGKCFGEDELKALKTGI